MNWKFDYWKIKSFSIPSLINTAILLSGERAIVIDELTKPYKVLLFESRNKNNEKIIKMKYGKKQATVSIVTPKTKTRTKPVLVVVDWQYFYPRIGKNRFNSDLELHKWLLFMPIYWFTIEERIKCLILNLPTSTFPQIL